MKRTRDDQDPHYPSRRMTFQPQMMVNLPRSYEVLPENLAHLSPYSTVQHVPSQASLNVLSRPPTNPPLPVLPAQFAPPSTASMPLQNTLQNQPQQFQRLKVEDALSYLDQVKLQFGNQPQVYNEFLDIMKEFKSQAIDTPGVIKRVSTLFRGHPELITGFNTFLPPGYKIEVDALEYVALSTPPVSSTTPQPLEIAQLPVGPQTTDVHTQTPATVTRSTVPTTAIPASASSTVSTSSGNMELFSASLQGPSSEASTPSTNTASGVPQQNAISYVTRVKARFSNQPDVYNLFLDILTSYQNSQKLLKENHEKLSEVEVSLKDKKLAADVYKRVGMIFKGEVDLLTDFSQFLPDTSYVPENYSRANLLAQRVAESGSGRRSLSGRLKGLRSASPTSSPGCAPKDPGAGSDNESTHQPKKKTRTICQDVPITEAMKSMTLSETAFFNKVRSALKNNLVYENFLRCLYLYVQEVISSSDLLQLISGMLERYPDLYDWFKEFMANAEQNPDEPSSSTKEKGALAALASMDIDWTSCKRNGVSYRALPAAYAQGKCPGRDDLCREVLNDTWVSLPSWSEDTQFPGTRKTQYEEYIYRCEDERFELDHIMESNSYTIRILEGIQRKLARMTSEEAMRFRLDNTLGGTSEVIHKKAVSRLYGDRAPDVLDGLKKTPYVAVPIVLKRLKQKEMEWRRQQREFNRIWKETMDKYYLKSLDHQGPIFKQNDPKYIRSKALIAEIEQLYDETYDGTKTAKRKGLSFTYKDPNMFHDATNIILHHGKRQSTISKVEKTRMKHLLNFFLPDLFFLARGDLSDDEESTESPFRGLPGRPKPDWADPEHRYNLVFCNNAWYVFLRLHQLLCDRLTQMFDLASKAAAQHAAAKSLNVVSPADELMMRPGVDLEPEEFYPAFLDLVKNLLDGNIDSNYFEDNCREVYSVHSYVAFTIDKLISSIVRQLQVLVSDPKCIRVVELFIQESRNNSTGGLVSNQFSRQSAELAYQRLAEADNSDENCYKVVMVKLLSSCTMTMELVGIDESSSESESGPDDTTHTVVDTSSRELLGSSTSQTVVRRSSVRSILLYRNLVKVNRRQINITTSPEQEKSTQLPMSVGPGSDKDFISLNPVKDVITMESSKDNVGKKLAGSWSVLLRQGCSRLSKAFTRTNKLRRKRFRKLVDEWIGDNVGEEDLHSVDEWLNGGGDLHGSVIKEKVVRMGVPVILYRYHPIGGVGSGGGGSSL